MLLLLSRMINVPAERLTNSNEVFSSKIFKASSTVSVADIPRVVMFGVMAEENKICVSLSSASSSNAAASFCAGMSMFCCCV